jgi:hypothetical protein
MKIIINVLLAIGLIITGCGPSPPSKQSAGASNVDQIKATDDLIIYTGAEFPPHEFIGTDMEAEKAIDNESDEETEIVNVNFDDVLEDFADKDINAQLGTTTLGAVNNEASEKVCIPLWMQPNTVIIYDNNLNYTIIEGGELSEADLIGRDDIASIGLTDPELLAKPNTKVAYEQHGFFQNIYYLIPGTKDEYRLSPPYASE